LTIVSSCYLVRELCVERGQLLVHRLQLLLRGRQLLVGGLQLFVHREDFFVGRLQLFVTALELLDQLLLLLLRGAELRLQPSDQLQLAAAGFLRRDTGGRDDFFEQDHPERLGRPVRVERLDRDPDRRALLLSSGVERLEGRLPVLADGLVQARAQRWFQRVARQREHIERGVAFRERDVAFHRSVEPDDMAGGPHDDRGRR
jgi:hypothetical protein